MRKVPFKKSKTGSVGTELELQIIDNQFFTLAQRSKDLIRNLEGSAFEKRIKPEITQSMIEINSSVHTSIDELYKELIELHDFLVEQTKDVDVYFCGGGTHPFQRWSGQKIFPTVRYRNILHKFRYLSKKATVFGQHVHIGCSNPEEALYLTHALACFTPQMMAISASSPFYEGMDSGYFSTRSTIFTSFPMSGMIPYLKNWSEFSDYYHKMRKWGVIESMKDIYWDVRPKPEFGTVEIRVFDTPLTIRKAVLVTAYAQALGLYLLEEKPIQLSPNIYYLYSYNRFQAERYGFDGEIIDPFSDKRTLIVDDILATLPKLEKYAERLGSSEYLMDLKNDIENKRNDAVHLRQLLKEYGSYPKLVSELCKEWKNYRGKNEY